MEKWAKAASEIERQALRRGLNEILAPEPEWWATAKLGEVMVSALFRLSALADHAARGKPRTASLDFLSALYQTVDLFHRQGRAGLFIDGCSSTRGLSRRQGESDFALLIRATLPNGDRRTRSKWANLLLRSFRLRVPSGDLAKRVTDSGGITAYAERVGRRKLPSVASNAIDDLQPLPTSEDEAEAERPKAASNKPLASVTVRKGSTVARASRTNRGDRELRLRPRSK